MRYGIMIMVYLALLWSEALPVVAPANGQCLEEVKAYIRRSMELSEPGPNKVYYLHLSMDNFPRNATESPQSMDIEVFRKDEALIYETKQVAVYKDSKDAFMVIHPLKRIVWEESNESFSDLKTTQIAEMQLTIIENSEVLSCTAIEREGRALKRMVLQPNEKIKEVFGAQKLTIDFDLLDELLKEVTIEFTAANKLKRQVISYHTYDYDYKERTIAASRDLIFTHEGALQPRLKGYSVIKN